MTFSGASLICAYVGSSCALNARNPGVARSCGCTHTRADTEPPMTTGRYVAACASFGRFCTSVGVETGEGKGGWLWRGPGRQLFLGLFQGPWLSLERTKEPVVLHYGAWLLAQETGGRLKGSSCFLSTVEGS